MFFCCFFGFFVVVLMSFGIFFYNHPTLVVAVGVIDKWDVTGDMQHVTCGI